jgi:carbamoyltransferase
MPFFVLGINATGALMSACILKDGNIIAASAEERFSRIKRDSSFPHNAIKFCLQDAGITFSQLDLISVGWNPAFYMDRNANSVSQALKDKGLYLHYVVNELGSAEYTDSISHIEQNLLFKDGTKIPIEYTDHHLAHASYAFNSSGYDSALVVVLDGYGEIHTGGIFKIDDKKHDVISTAKFPHSIGLFYSAITQYLGFRPNSDEWKVMALASSGNSENYKQQFSNMIKVGKDAFNGMLELDLSYFDYYNFFTSGYTSDKFISSFGNPRKSNEPLEQKHKDISRALQEVVEEKVIELLTMLNKEFDSEKNLCLSGGFFMNSVLNGKIRKSTSFNDPFLGSTPDDTGVALGSAILSLRKMNMAKTKKQIHSFFGPKYDNDEIIHELEVSKIKFEEILNPEEDAAKLLSEGKIIGWFQGRSELGQRALGNRSILASPTFEWMKDHINKFIKFREEFRPFAPSILDEKKIEYFDMNSNDEVFFMEKVFPFLEDIKKKIPAVVHDDGTGRVQTVTENSNPKFYKLIKEFSKITSIPILLNTSFNTNNVPIVNSPRDAIDTFYRCGIDGLYMNNIKVTK